MLNTAPITIMVQESTRPTALRNTEKKCGPLQTRSRHDSRPTKPSRQSDTRNRVSERRRATFPTMTLNVGINCSADHCSKSDSNEEVEQFPRKEAPIKEEEAR